MCLMNGDASQSPQTGSALRCCFIHECERRIEPGRRVGAVLVVGAGIDADRRILPGKTALPAAFDFIHDVSWVLTNHSRLPSMLPERRLRIASLNTS
jgi:hypothetical protein